MFGRIFPYGRRARRPGGDALQDTVHVVRATPFLVREYVAADFFLFPLYKLYIG